MQFSLCAPALDSLFPCNSSANVAERLEVYKTRYVVHLCESLGHFVPVFNHPPCEIVRYAGVKNS